MDRRQFINGTAATLAAMNAESVWGRNPRGYPIGIKTTLPPTFAPGAGTYTSIQTVTMSCLTPFAVIYYTTNGSTPTTGSTIYTSPITVGTTETVKAIAQAPGATASSVTSALYTINLTTTATPTFSPPAGSYSSEQTVAISCSTPSSTIYYTTNGTTPTTSSPVYTGPISVGGTSTIQAIATAAGFLQSAVGSATYTITNSTQYVGTNISVLQDAPTEQPFLNIAKLTGTSYQQLTGWYPSGATTFPQLLAVLDSNGYLTSLPNGTLVTSYLNSQMNNQDPLGAFGTGIGNGPPPGAASLYPTGSYSFQFQGACTLTLAGDVVSGSLATSSANVSVAGLTITSTMTSGQTGVVTFNVTSTSVNGISFNITALPSPSNYFRNHAIVRSSQLAAYNAGTLCDPNWVAMVTNAGAGGYQRIRYMNALGATVSGSNNGTQGMYCYQLPALTTGSSLTQTMTAVWNGPSITLPCLLGNGSALDVAQNNTVTLTYNSAIAVFGSAFTQAVSAGNTNLWIPAFNGWAARQTPSMAFWSAGSGGGFLPYETCLAMSAATDTDCWLNIPVWANSFTSMGSAFWTGLANLCYTDSLSNPGRKYFLEFANEIFIEADEAYCNMLAKTTFGTADFTSWIGYQLALISQAFSAVFGASFASTIRIGPSTQFAVGNGSSFLVAMMNGPSIGGGTYPNSFLTSAPYTYFTHWSIAPYMPPGGISSADLTTMMGVANPLNDFFACMYGNVGTVANGSITYSSINSAGMVGQTVNQFSTIKSAATSGQPWASFPVHCYEGGPNFGATGYSSTAGSYTGPYGGGAYTTLRSAVTALFINANRDPRMGYALYDPTHQLSSNPGFLPALVSAGVTSLTYFDDCQFEAQYGVWGALSNVMQLPSSGGSGTAASYPKYAAIMDYIEGIVPATFDYYISTTGSDSNNGLTPATAWALTSLEVTSSNQSKMAGKRTGLIAGNYSMSGITSPYSGSSSNYVWCWLNLPGGTSGSPTYLGSSNTSGFETPRAATITWTGGASNIGLIGSQNQNTGTGQNTTGGYVTLSGIIINGNNLDGAAGHCIQFYGGYGTGNTSAASMTGITVQNCEAYGILASVAGNNYSPLFLEGVYGSLFTNNSLHDCVSTSGNTGHDDHNHPFEEYGCYNNTFTYNTCFNCTSGIDAKDADQGGIYAYNYFYNLGTPGTGGCAAFEGFDGANQHGSPPPVGPGNAYYSIHHNVVDSCGVFHAPDIETNISYLPIYCYNNTIYDARASGSGAVNNSSSSGSGMQWYNNIYYCTQAANGAGGFAYLGKINLQPSQGAVNYNCYYSATSVYTNCWGLVEVGYSTIANWHTASGYDANGITANPSFTSSITPGDGPNQFQLGSGSPCLAAGKVGGTSGGATINMGAWDGLVTQIGCNFTTATTSYPLPAPINPIL